MSNKGRTVGLFSFGNTKLPRTTAIFNMSSATDCRASRKGLCQLKNINKCYARKAEIQYPPVLPFRRRQEEFWSKCTAHSFISKLLECSRTIPITHLRLNEAGDFKTQRCVGKAVKIAKILKDRYDITTYCYTARIDLDFTKRGPLVINGSNFMVDNKYSITYTDIKQGEPKCIMNCRLCDLCAQKGRKVIKVKLH